MHIEGTGHQQTVDDSDIDKIPPFDPRSGNHFWIVIITYHVTDPERWYDPNEGAQLLDMENLVLVSGIGCFYCEQVYSKNLAHRRCKGYA